MNNDFPVLILIPARGGSKSILRKNLSLISRKSLLEITVKFALKNADASQIYVSSDDEEILNASRTLGCQTIIRTKNAATDSATASEVVADFIFQLDLETSPQTLIVYLQPTSPFRENDLITKALEIFRETRIPVVAVSEIKQHPQKSMRVGSKGLLEKYLSSSNPTANRQSLTDVVIPCGSIYLFSVTDFLKGNQIPVENTVPLFLQGLYTLDIDSELDLEIARLIGATFDF